MKKEAKTAAEIKVGDVILFAPKDLPARVTEIHDNSDPWGHSGLCFFAEFIDENEMPVCDTAFVRELNDPVTEGRCFRGGLGR